MLLRFSPKSSDAAYYFGDTVSRGLLHLNAWAFSKGLNISYDSPIDWWRSYVLTWRSPKVP